jgi:adenosylcobyric acid synthase
MLGHKIEDPDNVETAAGADKSSCSTNSNDSNRGLGLLDITTTIESEKATFRVEATVQNPFSSEKTEFKIEGYEVHMGRSQAFSPTRSKDLILENEREFGRIFRRNRAKTEILDGAVSADGRVWGSYIHGLFDSVTFRASLIESVREARGLGTSPTPSGAAFAFSDERNRAFDSLAKVLKEHLDMEAILSIMGLESSELENDSNKEEFRNSNIVRG